MPYLKHLTILQQAPNEKVIYEQIRMPLVRDRDYTVKVTGQNGSPRRGGCRSPSCRRRRTEPPAQDGYVRVTAIHGSWTLVPTRDGGTLVTYVVSSDPGGALPAWLVNRAQRHAAPALVKAMLDRAKYNLAQIAERRQ